MAERYGSVVDRMTWVERSHRPGAPLQSASMSEVVSDRSGPPRLVGGAPDHDPTAAAAPGAIGTVPSRDRPSWWRSARPRPAGPRSTAAGCAVVTG